MTKTPDKLREILEKFRDKEINRRYDESEEILEITPTQSVDQTKYAIEELFEEMLPEKEMVPVLNERSTFSDTFEFWNITGRNAVLDEIRKRWQEGKDE